jgi:hypothetical protein
MQYNYSTKMFSSLKGQANPDNWSYTALQYTGISVKDGQTAFTSGALTVKMEAMHSVEASVPNTRNTSQKTVF